MVEPSGLTVGHQAVRDLDARVGECGDGAGGADPARGTGILGIRARVHAVDGTFAITSPVGGPTTLVAEIPRQTEVDRG